MYARNNSAPHTVGATLSPGGEEKANRYTWKLNRLLNPLQINHFTISNRNKIAFSDFSTHPKIILFFFAGERSLGRPVKDINYPNDPSHLQSEEEIHAVGGRGSEARGRPRRLSDWRGDHARG